MRLVDDPLVMQYYNDGLRQEFNDLVVRITRIVEQRQNNLPVTTKELIDLLEKETRRNRQLIVDAIAFCLKKNKIQYLHDTSDWKRYQRLSLRR